MKFDGFVGNEQAKRLVSAAVDSGRFPHAILIEGPVGSGRKHLARLIAKAAVCVAQEKPCGVCAQCRKADTGHADITVVQGDGSAKSMNVALIRELREQAGVIPNEAARKVVILADADCMNVQAQNALLKILEEPPSYMVFILTAASRTQFLPTVQSRCVSVTLGGVSEAQALEVLTALHPEHPREDWLSRVRLYSGCIGECLRSMTDESFTRTVEIIRAVAGAIAAPTELMLLKATAPLEKDKPLTDAVLHGVQLVLRDALTLSAGGNTMVSVAPEAAKILAGAMTRRQLLNAVEAMEELQTARRRNMNHTLLITMLCARLRAAAGR